MVLLHETNKNLNTCSRPSPRVVLHVDLDAFFCQVERSLNPTLVGVDDRSSTVSSRQRGANRLMSVVQFDVGTGAMLMGVVKCWFMCFTYTVRNSCPLS